MSATKTVCARCGQDIVDNGNGWVVETEPGTKTGTYVCDAGAVGDVLHHPEEKERT